MPVYIHLANIVIQKSTIKEKYNGGIKQFKTDYDYGEGKYHQEDDELFSIAYQNLYRGEFQYLSEKGLHYDKLNDFSKDFVPAFRYGGLLWKSDWLDANVVFAWHKDCEPKQITRAQQIGNMLMDDFIAANERGERLFATIRKDIVALRGFSPG